MGLWCRPGAVQVHRLLVSVVVCCCLLVGTLAVYRMSEVEARLNAAGVRLERVPHEDDYR